LRREFLQLQAKAHPDLAAQDQKRQAEALSMRVNEAYKTLQDPLRRARYLLSLRGIDVEDDSAKLEENELLMEVMEAREAVEEVENEEQLVEIREGNNERIDASVSVLSEAFADGDMDRAAQEAVRLRYWVSYRHITTIRDIAMPHEVNAGHSRLHADMWLDKYRGINPWMGKGEGWRCIAPLTASQYHRSRAKEHISYTSSRLMRTCTFSGVIHCDIRSSSNCSITANGLDQPINSIHGIRTEDVRESEHE
jgi:Fe-S protein assembly co-chaperone HscB